MTILGPEPLFMAKVWNIDNVRIKQQNYGSKEQLKFNVIGFYVTSIKLVFINQQDK